MSFARRVWGEIASSGAFGSFCADRRPTRSAARGALFGAASGRLRLDRRLRRTLTRLSRPAALRTAGRVQDGRLDRLVRRPARKKKHRRPRQSPIAAQNGKQRLGQHHVSLFAALAALDPHHHARAVDVRDLQGGDFGNPQARGIGHRQGDAALRLESASRKRTTSSALSTTGSLRGSRA